MILNISCNSQPGNIYTIFKDDQVAGSNKWNYHSTPEAVKTRIYTNL